MNRLRVLKASWYLAHALGKVPSRRVLQEITKAAAGSAFRTDEVHAFLKAWQYRGDDGLLYLRKELGPVWVQCGSSAGPVLVLENTDLGPPRVHLGSPRADLKEKIEKYPDTNVSDSPAIAEQSTALKATPKKTTRKPKDSMFVPFELAPEVAEPYERLPADDLSQPLWVQQMRAWVATIMNKPLNAVKPNEMFALARYHAWRWANCTRDEAKSKAAAGKIVAGLRTLADDRRYGAMTVNSYILAGDDFWEQMGKKPSFKVWPVISQLEKVT